MKRIILCAIAVILSACAFAQNPVYDTVVTMNGNKATVVVTPKVSPVATFVIDSVPPDFSQQDIALVLKEKISIEKFRQGSAVKILPIFEFKHLRITDTYITKQSPDGSIQIKKIDSKEEFVGVKQDKRFSFLVFYMPLLLIILSALTSLDSLSETQILEKEKINTLLRGYAILLCGIISFSLMIYFNAVSIASVCVLGICVIVMQLFFFKAFAAFVFHIIAFVLFLLDLYVATFSRIERHEPYEMILFGLVLCFVVFLVIAFFVRKLSRMIQAKFRFSLANRI